MRHGDHAPSAGKSAAIYLQAIPALWAAVWVHVMSEITLSVKVLPNTDASGAHPGRAALHVAIAV